MEIIKIIAGIYCLILPTAWGISFYLFGAKDKCKNLSTILTAALLMHGITFCLWEALSLFGLE